VTFSVDVVGTVLHLAVCGELDSSCAEQFDGLFDLGIEGIRSVELDLTDLTFCDVSGVNALIGLRSFHQAYGRDVRLVGVRPQVRRLISWTEQAATRPRAAQA
jgi:anti-sigma B factor antagonist